MKRLYSQNAQLGINIIIGDELAHVYSARLRQNEEVTLINGDGNDYNGKLTRIDKKQAEITVTDIVKNQTQPCTNLTLYIGNPKADKLELITQKLTELGAVRIRPFISQNSTTNTKINIPRLTKIAIEAAKQSGAATITEITTPIPFTQLLNEIPKTTTIFPYEKEQNTTLSQVLKTITQANQESGNKANQELGNQPNKEIALIIGSEGGFTNQEARQITEQGAISVSLGKRILRTETAAITTTATILTLS